MRMFTILWLTALLAFVVARLTSGHGLLVAMATPLLMMGLSLRVFNGLPQFLRLIHHVVVGLGIAIILIGSLASIYFGGDQPAIGAYLLGYATGTAYLCFVVVLLIACGVHYGIRQRRFTR